MADSVTSAQWRIFFDALGEANSVSIACRKSKIPRSTAYWHQKNDVNIKERWQEALQTGVEYLTDAATERAVIGVTSTHRSFSRGELVYEEVETKYSDGLLKMLLAARDPAFRQTTNDQVQAKLQQELTRMLDLFQRKLSPEIYQQVIEVLANGDDVIDAATTSQEKIRYLTGD